MVGIKEITLGVYGILSTWFLCLFVWWAVLYGGESGKVILYFNIYNEMWLEFFLLNGLFVLMISSFISMLKKEFAKK